MRITITADSATPNEVMALTRAFQRAVKCDGLPQQVTTEPTIQVLGSYMTWTSPAMHLSTATGILTDEPVRVETGGEHPLPGSEVSEQGLTREDERQIAADDEHAWFLNEDGEPYMYERDEQRIVFPNDDHREFDTYQQAAEAARAPYEPDATVASHPEDCRYCEAGEPGLHNYEQDTREWFEVRLRVPREADDTDPGEWNWQELVGLDTTLLLRKPMPQPATWWDFKHPDTQVTADTCEFYHQDKCAGRVGIERRVHLDFGRLLNITGRMRCERHVKIQPK